MGDANTAGRGTDQNGEEGAVDGEAAVGGGFGFSGGGFHHRRQATGAFSATRTASSASLPSSAHSGGRRPTPYTADAVGAFASATASATASVRSTATFGSTTCTVSDGGGGGGYVSSEQRQRAALVAAAMAERLTMFWNEAALFGLVVAGEEGKSSSLHPRQRRGPSRRFPPLLHRHPSPPRLLRSASAGGAPAQHQRWCRQTHLRETQIAVPLEPLRLGPQ